MWPKTGGGGLVTSKHIQVKHEHFLRDDGTFYPTQDILPSTAQHDDAAVFESENTCESKTFTKPKH